MVFSKKGAPGLVVRVRALLEEAGNCEVFSLGDLVVFEGPSRPGGSGERGQGGVLGWASVSRTVAHCAHRWPSRLT